MRTKTRVAVVGVSGYSGVELSRLLDAHPAFELAVAVADRWKGSPLGEHVRLGRRAGAVVVAPMSEAVQAASEAEIALLATPAEVSAKLAPELIARGARVLDLSGAFRLADPADYPRWYGFDHPSPELLVEARYGLPEVPAASGSAPPLASARLVANPGCYATAAIVALAPLLAAGLMEPDVFVDGKSGVTGAGRKVEERYLFTEVAENLAPYRVASHQHTPEIELALSRAAGRTVRVTFAAHLLPVRRGLLCTAFGRLAGATTPPLDECLRAFYAPSAEVEVVAPEEVTLARVVSTARAAVGARANVERGSVVALGALDNLLKGAASQALQNLCGMVGTAFHTERTEA